MQNTCIRHPYPGQALGTLDPPTSAPRHRLGLTTAHTLPGIDHTRRLSNPLGLCKPRSPINHQDAPSPLPSPLHQRRRREHSLHLHPVRHRVRSMHSPTVLRRRETMRRPVIHLPGLFPRISRWSRQASEAQPRHPQEKASNAFHPPCYRHVPRGPPAGPSRG